MSRFNLEVCLTPAIFDRYADPGAIVVVIDTLRASSAICNAFANGASSLIPVKGLEEAREYKNKGYMVAAERDGYVQDFADFGNSPFNFTPERVKGQTIVYSTTNGTRSIQLASECYRVVIGSFLNISSLEKWLLEQDRDIIFLCAGWKSKVSLEDSVFAGALADRLLRSNKYNTICDSVNIVLDIWKLAEPDIVAYIDKAAQRSRLRDKGLDDCIPFCHTEDSTDAIPYLEENRLYNIKNRPVNGPGDIN
ncbi:MAG TPA: 2-phosphosulfolactate phosphatase [Bacteroidales bacterium]|nr:2-phosphosulfolactate phosphatase [Bacteroidales bacterium]